MCIGNNEAYSPPRRTLTPPISSWLVCVLLSVQGLYPAGLVGKVCTTCIPRMSSHVVYLVHLSSKVCIVYVNTQTKHNDIARYTLHKGRSIRLADMYHDFNPWLWHGGGVAHVVVYSVCATTLYLFIVVVDTYMTLRILQERCTHIMYFTHYVASWHIRNHGMHPQYTYIQSISPRPVVGKCHPQYDMQCLRTIFYKRCVTLLPGRTIRRSRITSPG